MHQLSECNIDRVRVIESGEGDGTFPSFPPTFPLHFLGIGVGVGKDISCPAPLCNRYYSIFLFKISAELNVFFHLIFLFKSILVPPFSRSAVNMRQLLGKIIS